jgi:hypothetical protein
LEWDLRGRCPIGNGQTGVKVDKTKCELSVPTRWLRVCDSMSSSRKSTWSQKKRKITVSGWFYLPKK